jgi:hypothetical protein
LDKNKRISIKKSPDRNNKVKNILVSALAIEKNHGISSVDEYCGV